MASLIYPDLSWSGRFSRFIRTLQIVAIAGTVGVAAGGLAVIAAVRPSTNQPPLHTAIPVAAAPMANGQPRAMVARSPATAVPLPSAATPAQSSFPSAVTSASQVAASRFTDRPQSRPLDDSAPPPPLAAAATAVPLPMPSPLPKVHVPIQARRTVPRAKKPMIIAVDPPPQSPPAGYGYGQPPQRRYYDAWRGPLRPSPGDFFGDHDDARNGGWRDDGGGRSAGGFWGGGGWR